MEPIIIQAVIALASIGAVAVYAYKRGQDVAISKVETKVTKQIDKYELMNQKQIFELGKITELNKAKIEMNTIRLDTGDAKFDALAVKIDSLKDAMNQNQRNIFERLASIEQSIKNGK